MERLEQRTAVVTGAASGIGLAVTEALAGAGMNVVMADRSEDALEEQASRLSADGARVLAVVTDVSDPEAVERLGQAAVDTFGRLHVAVNNAGVVNRGNSWELSLAEWHRVLDVNLWGVVHGIRSFVPRILDSGEEGHVVNTASMASVTALAKLGPYTVAKHGVLGLSDVLRAELDARGAPVGVRADGVAVHVGEDDAHALGHERLADRQPDAAGRPRDHGDPPLEALHAGHGMPPSTRIVAPVV